MAKFGIGDSVRRLEDPRLLTGGGRYTDDTKLSAPPARAYVLRSPHAQAARRRQAQYPQGAIEPSPRGVTVSLSRGDACR